MQLKNTLTLAMALAAGLHAPARAESVETAVDRETTLLVEVHSGTLIVQTWDRDFVEMQAWGDEPLQLDLRKRGRRLRGTVEGGHGHPVEADVEVRMPAWMPLEVEGRELDCEIESLSASIEARVLGGDLLIQGGRGRIRVHSVHGSVTLRGSSGQIDIHATNDDIRMHDVEGQIIAETVHGDIRIEGARSREVELVSTSGDLLYDGAIERDGEYFFSTHEGDVRLAIPPDTSALLEIETYKGEVQVQGASLEAALVEVRRDREYRAELGEGQARVRIQNFNGNVELYDLKRGRRKDG